MTNIKEMLPKVITSKDTIEDFDPNAIVKSLEKEIGLKNSICKKILTEIIRKIISGNVKYLTAPMIRELVCSVLIELGYEKERFFYTRLGLPLFDFRKLINSELSKNRKKDIVYAQIEKEYYEILKLYKNGE